MFIHLDQVETGEFALNLRVNLLFVQLNLDLGLN
jgi:hypothetical protein